FHSTLFARAGTSIEGRERISVLPKKRKRSTERGAVARFLPSSSPHHVLANSRNRIAAASPARSNPAKTRNSREEGTVGMGPGGLLGGNGGSRTPIPVNLRAGPPPRAEEACGSSSYSFSTKS